LKEVVSSVELHFQAYITQLSELFECFSAIVWAPGMPSDLQIATCSNTKRFSLGGSGLTQINSAGIIENVRCRLRRFGHDEHRHGIA